MAPRGEPQEEQNRPEAGSPQFGQGLEAEDSVMATKIAIGIVAGSSDGRGAL